MNVLKEGKKEIILLLILFCYNKNTKYSLIILIILVLFFRAPPADFLINDKEILSPTYGTISLIEEIDVGTKINILLNIFDVHVQYIPYNGKVEHLKHISGTLNPFFLTSSEKTDNNERMYTIISTDIGVVTIIQYAGMIARRIVNNLNVNDNVEKGDIFGMIKFSSRVDIIIPKGFQINVVQGEKIQGGKTIIAKIT